MRALDPRRLWLAAMLAILGLMTGCDDDERKPMPMVNIVVLAEDNSYLLNDQRMGLRELKVELRRIADETRRPVTNACRAYVRLDVKLGADRNRADEVVSFCNGVGLVQIENQAAGN